MALNTLYVSDNTKGIGHTYKSKYNLDRNNQGILLIITDGEKRHYLPVKNLSALLKGITSNHKGDFYYCSNVFQSYSTKEKTEKHENVCKNLDYCYVEMPK